MVWHLFRLVFILDIIILSFTQELTYYVTEETNVGQVIANLIQDSGISNDVGEMRLIPRQSQYASYFRLEANTGDLVVASVLDREEICLKLSTCDIELDLGVLEPDQSLQLLPLTIRYSRATFSMTIYRERNIYY